MIIYMLLKKLILTNDIWFLLTLFISVGGICCKMTIVSIWPCKDESKMPK